MKDGCYYMGVCGHALNTTLISRSYVVASEGIFGIEFHNLWTKKSVLWIYIFRDRLMLFYVGLGACLKKILISVSSVVASEGIFWIEFHNLWTKNITLCGYKFSIICNKWRIDDILWGFVGTPSRKVWISGSSVVASEGILGLEFQTFELKKSLFVDINVPLYAI